MTSALPHALPDRRRVDPLLLAAIYPIFLGLALVVAFAMLFSTVSSSAALASSSPWRRRGRPLLRRDPQHARGGARRPGWAVTLL